MQGWDQLPQKFQENVRLLHNLNSDFKHMQWTEASLRTECEALGAKYLATYDGFQHMISKVDFGRYVVLYNHGGISIDTDMEPMRSLRETPGLTEHDFIISASSIMGSSLLNTVNNAVFIVTPGHPLLLAILDAIITQIRSPLISKGLHKELYVQLTTGPFFLNYFLADKRSQMYVLDSIYFEPSTPTAETIMNHRHELSWMNPCSAFIIKQWNLLLLFFLIIGIAIIGSVQAKHSSHNIGNDRSFHKSPDLGR